MAFSLDQKNRFRDSVRNVRRSDLREHRRRDDNRRTH